VDRARQHFIASNLFLWTHIFSCFQHSLGYLKILNPLLLLFKALLHGQGLKYDKKSDEFTMEKADVHTNNKHFE
jgi:hypothetical protein